VRRWWTLLLLPAVVASSCTPGDPPVEAAPVTTSVAPVEAAPTTTAAAPEVDLTVQPRALGGVEPQDPALSAWVVGASTLPVRPDGFGEILPTPEVLVVRALPTSSRLPSPATDAFESSIGPIDPDLRRRMGETWRPGCPVELHDLRYVTVSFWGFDGAHHAGELILHAEVATDVVGVFERLHDARFPIEEMRLITTADLEAPPTGDGNNTASFVCRSVRGGSSWSEHARGLAVDLNPFHNPYARGDVVLPELASAYLDRTWHRPGMIRPGDAVTEAFAAIGWRWGGDWTSPDYMHFSRSGR
jgi:hypothetical protein